MYKEYDSEPEELEDPASKEAEEPFLVEISACNVLP
jgi:hypothetical protein